ncbi:hypothetical protein Airi02_012030 [Actinoallomurus iriomotensis]|uniref:Uncharacterized protein n=2 Tax=Actinoallomurus iriomotensis TaxID=478107 RepID=A0A9W6VSE8_9ACTN|nr:hypothetical protein Airi02_012030 [Actinoallomurus iriomotensis]
MSSIRRGPAHAGSNSAAPRTDWKGARMHTGNPLAPARRAHGRQARAEADSAAPAPSPDDAQTAAAPPERRTATPKRPRTPADPTGTDRGGMWPDLWAAHRC